LAETTATLPGQLFIYLVFFGDIYFFHSFQSKEFLCLHINIRQHEARSVSTLQSIVVSHWDGWLQEEELTFGSPRFLMKCANETVTIELKNGRSSLSPGDCVGLQPVFTTTP
jgi:hypothetical protein